MTTTSGPDHRAAVAAETAAFVALVKDADLSVPVPTCPGWTLADLIRHTGSVQRWFSALLRRRVQERPTGRDVDLQLPEQQDRYPAWLAASGAEAAEAFVLTDLDAPMWVWGADGHARFWVRRMLFETLVHRTDAERALGLSSRIDRLLAVDGVDEFLANLPYAFFFAPKVTNLVGPDRAIRFECTDSEDQWLVRLRPDGFAVDHDDAGAPADATVRASAADLLLLLYGRLDRTAEAVQLAGDTELLDHWFANSVF